MTSNIGRNREPFLRLDYEFNFELVNMFLVSLNVSFKVLLEDRKHT